MTQERHDAGGNRNGNAGSWRESGKQGSRRRPVVDRGEDEMIRATAVALSLAFVTMPAMATTERPTGQPPERVIKDRDCVRECRDTNRACVQASVAATRMCADETCSDEIAATQAACAAGGVRTAECRAAREAQANCVKPCREQSKEALRACHAAGRECSAACPAQEAQPPLGQKDPACVSGCRVGHAECINSAHGDHRLCTNACQDLIAAARVACANTRDRACAGARQPANDCLAACSRSLRTASAACTGAANQCVRDCTARVSE